MNVPADLLLLQRHVSKLLVDMSLFDLIYKEPRVYIKIIQNFSDFSLCRGLF